VVVRCVGSWSACSTAPQPIVFMSVRGRLPTSWPSRCGKLARFSLSQARRRLVGPLALAALSVRTMLGTGAEIKIAAEAQTPSDARIHAQALPLDVVPSNCAA